MAQVTGFSVFIEGRAGPQSLADGAVTQQQRAGRTGESVVGFAHAPYYEAVSRGKVFCAANQSAVTFGTALTATGVTFHLHNPRGSPVNLVLLQTQATVVTATIAGSIVYAANVNNAAAEPTTTTALTVRNAKLDGSAGYGVAYSVATLAAAPVAIRQFVSVVTAAGVAQLIDYVDGAIVIGPATTLSLQGITVAGTGLFGMVWEEVPI